VFGPAGRVVAALSVVSPIERFTSSEMAAQADAVREVGADLSEELGAPLARVAFLRNRQG